ncbi:hypothetical protein JAAARDRAFT_53516 [Jaapia argillacea MUCL 33604]|uniref:F-box domain-containing protein n=1 Tax=Jaapia argillacea MUCL 33604 TaxID=933084 RepID=A0A067QKZ2_9AGAM|nr:hypothetical protein JAAARDRAFT_53516 [Jaapia argillacea MUCL 33604]
MYLSRRESLDTLPNEILSKVVSAFEQQPHIPRKFRLISVFARVNRRLRSFSMPLILQDLTVRSCDRLSAFVEFLEGCEEAQKDYPYLSYVRSIRIGGKSRRPNDYNVLYTSPLERIPLLPNLLDFECVDSPLTPKFLSSLAIHKSIRHLDLAWMSTFPDTQQFPSLRALRLHISPSLFSLLDIDMSPPLHTHSSLTTLSIDSSYTWFDSIVGHLNFPNLRVFCLQKTYSKPSDIFQFIHEHPSLMEVNVGFLGFDPVHMRALELLIEDTVPNWRDNSDFAIFAEEGWCFGGPCDVYSLRAFAWMSIDVEAFAFKRVPITPEALSYAHCRRPRYMATEVALRLRSEQPDQEDLGNSPFIEIFDLGSLVAFHSVQYLCVECPTGQATDFANLMVGPTSFLEARNMITDQTCRRTSGNTSDSGIVFGRSPFLAACLHTGGICCC